MFYTNIRELIRLWTIKLNNFKIDSIVKALVYFLLIWNWRYVGKTNIDFNTAKHGRSIMAEELPATE